MRRILFTAAVAVAAAGITTTSADAAPIAGFSYTSEPGAQPLSGSASWSAPTDDVAVWEYDGAVKVDAATADQRDYARVELSAPSGEQLHEGTYLGAHYRAQLAPQLAGPGIFIVRGAFGCGDTLQGDFTITHLTRAPDGTLTALDATFTERCGGPDTPAATGEVHFHG
ncbi:hypothetical protein VSH64_41695 [Amycolatopsis rhabdoformis]|uniref:Uncharacterized protein n=1 Tax=Amycolatopsis rhabdoformis TaxID=1448059 RepID=A0ABZ1I5L1_9PSEU|nr:hypothetical protein [Amycolatopsis rhabdoformis]WSE29256.1 hypothetical protein VSH64_41695 [Amycolatopsis rhabdoformis]